MNRIALGVVLLLLGAAGARTSSYAQRVSEFRDRCTEASARLGGGASARALFPTPELRLLANRLPVVRPGETVTVKAQGRIAHQSLVLFDCDELEVLSLKQTTTEVEARVRAPMLALPKTCHLSAFSPVTAFSKSIEAVQISGSYVWKVVFFNGMRAEVTVRPGPSGLEARSAWFEGDRPLGERAMQLLDLRTPGELKAKVERTAEDQQAAVAAQREATVQFPTGPLFQQVHALEQRQRTECEHSARRFECFQETNAQLAPLRLQLESAKRQQEEARLRHPVACDELQLAVAEDGTVSGQALHCASSERTPVGRGTMTVVP